MFKRIILIVILIAVGFYCLLWLFSFKKYPVEWGISFNQDHATSLGLDWKKNYQELLTDLKPKYVRVAAMWSDVEWQRGNFDWSKVDFMLSEAAKNNTKVTLVIGVKAPRWPECHVPDWYTKLTDQTERQAALTTYLSAVVQRYHAHPALELWQVENEPYIKFVFGECQGYEAQNVAAEIALVKKLDPDHSVLVTDSGELSTWREAIRAGDIFGTTMYRVVQTPNGHFFYYDWVPAGFYHFKAWLLGKNMNEVFVAELQAEPWFTNSTPLTASAEEQLKSMNPERLQNHLDYAQRVGSPRVYLWGVEWWYFMKEKKQDTQYWDIVKKQLAQ